MRVKNKRFVDYLESLQVTVAPLSVAASMLTISR
jgi:hypothetical protein